MKPYQISDLSALDEIFCIVDKCTLKKYFFPLLKPERSPTEGISRNLRQIDWRKLEMERKILLLKEERSTTVGG